MERTADIKYYLVVNGVIDRSVSYETAKEVRRAAKNIKAENLNIAVEKFTRDFFEI